MRHAFPYTAYFKWSILGSLSMVLVACSDGDGNSDIRFVNYYPNESKILCSYNSEFTFGLENVPSGVRRRLNPGERPHYVTKINSLEVVPYTSGELSGYRYVRTEADSGDNKVVNSESIYKSGGMLTYLEYGALNDKGIFVSGWYSTDCNLTSPPKVWSFGVIRDGEIRDQNTEYYMVERDLHPTGPLTCLYGGLPDNQTLLTKIENVHLQNGDTFSNAVIFYYLSTDPERSYVNLDMDGIDTELGITLPTSDETTGLAVIGMDIYGYNTGWIAGGEFAANGLLHHFGEYTGEVCP